MGIMFTVLEKVLKAHGFRPAKDIMAAMEHCFQQQESQQSMGPFFSGLYSFGHVHKFSTWPKE
jgi:hypothetical protein